MAPPCPVSEPQSTTVRLRTFACFLVSTFVSSMGRTGYNIACAWILVAAGHGTTAVATFFAIVSVTELITSPFAGWLADRYDRRKLYLFADGVRFIATAVLAVAIEVLDLRWTIWVSAVLFASCDRVALTASQAMIPAVNVGLSMERGNAVVFFLIQIGSLVAAAMIGLLLGSLSPNHAFMFLTLAFAASVLSLMRIRGQPAAGSRNSEGDMPICHITARLCHLSAIYALLYTGGVLVSVVGPSFVFEEHSGSALDFGYLESAWSAGSILGALILLPVVRLAKMALLPVMILALTSLCFTTLPVLDLPCSLLTFAGLGLLYNLGRVVIEIALQASVQPAALGRVKGFVHCSGVSLGLILFILASLVVDKVEPSTIFLGYAAVIAFGSTMIAISVTVFGWT